MTHYSLAQQIRATCMAATLYIKSCQEQDGGFLNNTEHTASFYAGLIISCLSAVSSEQDAVRTCIIEKAVAFLLQKRSPQWTFRYSEEYPADLDDTFVALSALYSAHPEYCTETVLADIVSLLIQQESLPGGPYRTWITASKEDIKDIDIVVNSTIAYFLSLLDVETPQLQRYFEDAIEQHMLTSKYYDDEIVIIYFLSRAYKGKNISLLKERLLRRRDGDGSWGNSFHTALAVTALLRLGEAPETLTASVQTIVDTHYNGKWQPQHFFIESIEKETISYSYSSAHISACCVEALELYAQVILEVPSEIESADNEVYRFIEGVLKECRQLPLSIEAAAQLDQALQAVSIKDPSNEIILLPYHFAKALKNRDRITDDIVRSLAVANLLGWIGYTVYDSILDGEDTVTSLPLATTCVRNAVTLFRSVISEPHHYQTVDSILNGIDAVTLWERLHCSLEKQDDSFIIPTIFPDYGVHECLAEKSLGHALGPILLCLLQGFADQAVYVEHFFREYLIARQLNDDAHDWLIDLHNGFLNSVSGPVVQLWREQNTDQYLNVVREEKTLQQYFWEEQVDTVSDSILEHVTNARLILKNITVLEEVSFLEALLILPEQSARMAIVERDKTKRFLAAIEEQK
jgi:hypothetical protein